MYVCNDIVCDPCCDFSWYCVHVIYNELRMRGYSVDVGVIPIAERNQEGKVIRKQLESTQTAVSVVQLLVLCWYHRTIK